MHLALADYRHHGYVGETEQIHDYGDREGAHDQSVPANVAEALAQAVKEIRRGSIDRRTLGERQRRDANECDDVKCRTEHVGAAELQRRKQSAAQQRSEHARCVVGRRVEPHRGTDAFESRHLAEHGPAHRKLAG